MKATITTLVGLACVIVMLVMPTGVRAQEAEYSDQANKFSKEELTQMLAPIALYPDSLVAQMLMASTYPLELVEAERWRRENPGLKGDELDRALQDKTWDPSIKSLCHFPDVLFAMSEKLDQTRKLGDAFLGQEEEVTATIQELRRKAEEQGNLKSTGEQKVIVEREIIRIEPADPQVVYVPVYDPYSVYGPWWYPAYPPYYWYYPPGVVTGGFIGFGPRIFIGFDLFSWVWFDWPFHRIHINIHKTRKFHHFHHRRDFDSPVWKHNPVHRRGVAYRDRRTGESFGVRAPRVAPVRPETRGFPGRGPERPEVRPSQGPGERRDRTSVPQGGRGPSDFRDSSGRREGTVAPRVQPERERLDRDTPFRGAGEGNFERRAIRRGESSIRSVAPPPQSGDMRGGPGGETRRGGEIRQQGDGFRGGEIRQRGDGGSRGGEIRQQGGGGSRGGSMRQQGSGSRGGGGRDGRSR